MGPPTSTLGEKNSIKWGVKDQNRSIRKLFDGKFRYLRLNPPLNFAAFLTDSVAIVFKHVEETNFFEVHPQAS